MSARRVVISFAFAAGLVLARGMVGLPSTQANPAQQRTLPTATPTLAAAVRAQPTSTSTPGPIPDLQRAQATQTPVPDQVEEPAAPSAPARRGITGTDSAPGTLPNQSIPKLVDAPRIAIRAPSGLKSTGDVEVCAAHIGFAGELFCGAAIKAGHVVLIWEEPWPCAVVPCEPDGFRVYKDDFPEPVLFHETTAGRHQTAVGFAYPPPVFPQGPNASDAEKIKWQIQAANCFTVRSYSQDLGESLDSNKFCLADAPLPVKTTVLEPSAHLSRYIYEYDEAEESVVEVFTPGYDAPHVGASPNDLSIGEQSEAAVLAGDYAESDTDDWDYYAVAWRGAVRFDTSILHGTVTSALLHFDRVKTKYSSSVATNQLISCATRLMQGTDNWWQKDYGDQKITIPAQDFVSLPTDLTAIGDTITVDVRSLVQDWINGTTPNEGFVLRGGVESLPHDANRACLTSYTRFRLEVSLPINPAQP